MQKICTCVGVIVALVFADNLALERLSNPTDAVIEAVEMYTLDEEVSVIHTETTTTPPWIQLDPPWDPSVTFTDLSNQSDTWISMDVDALGRVYVVYQTPWTQTAAGPKCGWGVATSTDQGSTWDNRVYYINNTAYTMIQPDIDITDDGKIWVWGIFQSGSINFSPSFMRSSATCYNDPDSLHGIGYFAYPYWSAPECVTSGNGDQLCMTQCTIDRPTAGADSVAVLFTPDSVSWFILTFRPPGGNVGKTSLGINVSATDTLLTHAVDYVDTANGDWDVIWYHDTMGIYNLHGTYTANPYDDRFPSVFGDQNFTYLAFQGDIGGGNNEIFFDFSTDHGATWATLQNISNDGADEQYPRLHGAADIIGCAYNHGYINVFFNYSIANGQVGSWLAAPEIASDAASADTGYHCVGLLHTPAYYYCAWEDTRNMATDSIDIYIARRVAPIGIDERREEVVGPRTMLVVTPNPFNEQTHITCGNTTPMTQATVKIYSTAGQLVRTLDVPANRSAAVISWDGRDQDGTMLGAGIYFCELNVAGSFHTEKIIKLK